MYNSYIRVAASTLFSRTKIYSRELPLGSQSHSRISSLCVCARVPFVYKPSVNMYIHIYTAHGLFVVLPFSLHRHVDRASTLLLPF